MYRGINKHGSVEALSWTLDKEQAEWFANRFEMFGITGTVYQANINKEYVLAYFSREQEAVIDFTNKAKTYSSCIVTCNPRVL